MSEWYAEINLEDLSDIEESVVRSVMRSGEVEFKEAVIESLKNDIKTYLEEVDGTVNTDWINGVNWAIKIIKEASFDGKE